MNKKTKKDFLWIILFLIVFINGFEAGGYQASLWTIGKDFDLSMTSMGLYAAMELFATMLAPILLGGWADRSEKNKCISLMLIIQISAAVLAFLTTSNNIFLVSVFFLGLTTSALQFISIAALADAYPISGGKKVAYITTMYASGALVAPLVVDFYLRHNLGWRTLFAILAAGSILTLTGIVLSGSGKREANAASDSSQSSGDVFVLSGILLLGVIMCIYVGFENGFTFFVDTLFTDVLKSSGGKFALSLFWAVMIPSRFLVGRFSGHAKKILIGAIVAIPCTMLPLSASANPAVVMLLCVPLGLASGAIYPSVLTIMLPLAGKRTATATGIITSATGIGGVVFTAMTGYMADLWGMRFAMLALVSFFAISLLAALIVTRKA
ncbi:MAG: MFS transporter [Lachnospiraceae bacterium]|nr:MFS transporter [Lachnospiraceae bacterium]